ncbi:MAG: ubiquinol oxidase subunit II [Xanthomonadales bacterium]|nr:ubiquinol oxidase subunit II [Xanthomonadales bacterium]
MKPLRSLLLLPLALLGGCHMVLLDPAGDVARQQSDIMITTTIIIALIIVPVMIAIGIIAWRYRASNHKAAYDGKWDHSPQLELLVWAAPLLIIIAVGAISWIGTHMTDPYRPLDQVAPGKVVHDKMQPLEVDVVSMRWKWLFFYPQYGIATVNELAAPVDRPIHFKLTSSDMMDAFFVPDLAGMIYTMPGMQTKLHAVINHPGKFKGMSSNYSGAGFTDMRFWFYGMNAAEFEQWVAKVRASGHQLDTQTYTQLHQPQRAVPVHYYAGFAPGLYTRILNRCVNPGEVCIDQHMLRNNRHNMSMPAMDKHGHEAMSMPATDASKNDAAAAAVAH